MTTIDNKRKQRKRTIFLTHNQGVPGSCPGGPTELNSTVSRVYEVKFVNPFCLG